MPNPWDRPISQERFRFGDPNEEVLFKAVGRALTRWEGVEAALGRLFSVIVDCREERIHNSPSEQAFGVVTSSLQRAKMVAVASDAFVSHCRFFFDCEPEAEIYLEKISKILAEYRGWMERRNDIAHGYATALSSPDHSREEAPIVTTFTLCLPHGNACKWGQGIAFHSEENPAYQFISAEIEEFAQNFQALDQKIEQLCNELEEWRHSLNKG